jgi:hypothetical protein
MHLAPFADAAKLNPFDARPAIQITAQTLNELTVKPQVAFVPEHRIDLPLAVHAPVFHARHPLVENPFRRAVHAGEMRGLGHHAKRNALASLLHPEIKDRGKELVVRIARAVRLQIVPKESVVDDVCDRQAPRMGRRSCVHPFVAG